MVAIGATLSDTQVANIKAGFSVRTETGPTYSVALTDGAVLLNATGAPITVNLPEAATADDLYVVLKKIDSSSNAVTVDGYQSETIDGSLTTVLSAEFESVTVVCDGVNWHIWAPSATAPTGDSSIDHGNLLGLADDDHLQYFNTTRLEPLLDGYTTDAEFTSHTGDGTIHFTEASIDHGSIAGLADDDHLQYFNASRLEPLLDGYTTDAEFTAHTGDATIHFTEASIDHGSIAGLADDDHLQYFNNPRLESVLDGYTTDAEFTAHTGDATIHFTEASIDHGSIAGLADDDHLQYFNNPRIESLLDGYTTDAEFTAHTGDATIHFTEASIDHGSIAGLADDDHTQYFNNPRIESLLDGYTTDAEFTAHTGDATIHFTEASIDHGSIAGLADDDHLQYFNNSRLEDVLDGYATLTGLRSTQITGDQFRNGATAPTSATIGTTPTIPALLFDATNELVSAFIQMPVEWDQTQNATLRLVWALVNTETNATSLDVTLDYTVPVLNSTGDGIDKTSTQILMTETVTTANGLAVNDMYTITATLDANDATNPFSGVSALGFAFEIHLTNVTGVSSMHLVAGSIEYTATL